MSDDTDLATSRAPAPGRLRLVQEFINTRDVDFGTDVVGTPADARTWLTDHGLPAPTRLTGADAENLVALREGLRALALAHNGEPIDTAAVDVLNGIASRSPLVMNVGADGTPALVPAGAGVWGAVAELLAVVQAAAIDGTLARLKACRNDRCQWAFYDRSRNRSGAWCDMAVCGNRAKVRAFRRRH